MSCGTGTGRADRQDQNAAALHYAAEEAKLVDELKKKEQERLGLQCSLDQVTASVPAGTSLIRYQRGEMVSPKPNEISANLRLPLTRVG